MVTPGPENELKGESGSRGLGVQPPDAEKGLILHVLRIALNCNIPKSTLMNDLTRVLTQIFHFAHDMEARNISQSAQDG